jgi:hypothetical protein
VLTLSPVVRVKNADGARIVDPGRAA